MREKSLSSLIKPSPLILLPSAGEGVENYTIWRGSYFRTNSYLDIEKILPKYLLSPHCFIVVYLFSVANWQDVSTIIRNDIFFYSSAIIEKRTIVQFKLPASEINASWNIFPLIVRLSFTSLHFSCPLLTPLLSFASFSLPIWFMLSSIFAFPHFVLSFCHLTLFHFIDSMSSSHFRCGGCEFTSDCSNERTKHRIKVCA